MVQKVTVSVQDQDQETGSFSFYLDDALTGASRDTAIQSIVEAADVLIDGIVTGVTVAAQADTTGWTLKSSVDGSNDKLIGGRFIFTGTGNVGKAQLTLPSFENDNVLYVPAGSENIDTTDTDVAAFLAAFVGTSTVTNQGVEIAAISQAYEVFGNKR